MKNDDVSKRSLAMIFTLRKRINLSQIIDTYDPTRSGYEWADEAARVSSWIRRDGGAYIEARAGKRGFPKKHHKGKSSTLPFLLLCLFQKRKSPQ